MATARGLGRIFQRHAVYWIAYYYRGKEHRESSGSTHRKDAHALLKKRLGEIGRGQLVGPSEERLGLDEFLADLHTDYAVNGRASLPTLDGHLKALRAAFGGDRALAVTTPRIQHVQRAWQEAGVTNATINRRCSMLRRAFTLARRASKLSVTPYVPRLEEQSPPGRHMAFDVFVSLRDRLPHQAQRDFLELAYWYGIRAGQLRRTLLSNVSTERWALVYQPEQVKNRKPHIVPLEGRGLEIVQRLWATRRLDCPYLLHGRDCARRPEGKPCLGSLKKAWVTACTKAGLPVGRKRGGYVFHNTRHTAVTNMVHSGMPESLAMSVSGNRTRAVFDRYSIRREDAVREALEHRTAYVTERAGEPKILPLRGAK